MGLDNPIHLAFLLILLLVVFGAGRLPETGRSLGTGIRGFKDALGGEGGADASGILTPVVPTPAQAVQAPAQAAPRPAEALTQGAEADVAAARGRGRATGGSPQARGLSGRG